MKLTIHKKIGRTTYHFQVEGANLYEMVKDSEKLSFENVTGCGLCGSDNLRLGSRLGLDKYKYVFVQCNDCKAELTFGHRTDDLDVYYLRKTDAGMPEWIDVQSLPSNPKKKNGNNA